MSKLLVTKNMLAELQYDTKEMSLSNKAGDDNYGHEKKPKMPSVMVVFDGSDLNAAAYHLAKSLETSFSSSANTIATLLVQESVREKFIAMVQPQLPIYSNNLTKHQEFTNALEKIHRLNLKTVTKEDAPKTSATLVCDITHEHFGGYVSGIVTLHTFRGAKEAITLCNKESIQFVNASIWNENYSCAYELIAALNCSNFCINSFNVPLKNLESYISAGENFVTMDKNYHYETLKLEGVQKTIAFPIGTIFAN